jgi:hypothetical protein
VVLMNEDVDNSPQPLHQAIFDVVDAALCG